jgi:hypothetical protein
VSQKKAVKQLQKRLGLDIPIAPPNYEGVEITYPAPSERKVSQDIGTPKKPSNRRSNGGSNRQNKSPANRTGSKGSSNRRDGGARAAEKDSNESVDRPARGARQDRTDQGTTRKKRNSDKSHGGGSRGGGSPGKKTSRGDGRPVAKKRNTANSKGRR